MLDIEGLLRELNEVLTKHEARIYIYGFESEAWINHQDDRWTEERIRLTTWDGRLQDVEELYR